MQKGDVDTTVNGASFEKQSSRRASLLNSRLLYRCLLYGALGILSFMSPYLTFMMRGGMSTVESPTHFIQDKNAYNLSSELSGTELLEIGHFSDEGRTLEEISLHTRATLQYPFYYAFSKSEALKNEFLFRLGVRYPGADVQDPDLVFEYAQSSGKLVGDVARKRVTFFLGDYRNPGNYFVYKDYDSDGRVDRRTQFTEGEKGEACIFFNDAWVPNVVNDKAVVLIENEANELDEMEFKNGSWIKADNS